MKELIPFFQLIEELTKALGVKQSEEEKLSCVFEDNQRALTLANTEMPMTMPRTKHYVIKLHWLANIVSLERLMSRPLTPRLS